ncbi:MAG TPA: hypothetical protein VII39_09805 [Bradyrhizobium sp.]
MGDKRVFRVATIALALVLGALAPGTSTLVQPAAAQSLTDRFKSLFGGKPDEPASTAPQPGAPAAGGPPVETNLTCPSVAIRAGASTYAVAAAGKEPVGNDVRFQVTIGKTARECNLSGAEITARVGIQGRVIAGPAGAPSLVEIPLRIAVVLGGVSEKVIATKAYRTSVQMTEDGSVPFSFVADDLVYPAPSAADNDAYVFYIGFDPQALAPEPKVRARKKK